MTTIVKAPIHYRAARAGTAPATFGQRDMFAKLAALEPHTYPQNILQAAPVPAGMTVAEVRAVVLALALRHESLRTRFRHAPDGSLWQCLPASDEIGCETWEAGGEDVNVVAPRAERELERTHFDPVAGPPVRALIGTLHGAPSVVMIVISHLAADMLSARLIRQDLTDLLAARGKGEPDPELPPRRQPLDQAAFEASIGPARSGRVLEAWRSRLAAAPPDLLGTRAGPVVPREFLRATLTSEATTLAADALALRFRVTTAVVVMAAEAALLAHYAGADRAAVHVSVGNRISKELTWSAGIIRQHSLAVVDVRGASFAQLVARTWSAWMQAQRTGMYDPDAVRALRTEVQRERGARLRFGCYFNDLRLRTGPGTEPPTAERILAAAAGTRFAWTDEYPAHYAEFLLRLEDDGGSTRLTAFVDTAAVPRDRVRELMHGIERLLVWQATAGGAADGTLTAARLAQITGVCGAEPPTGWARIDGCWVDPAATGELLARATGGAPSTVRESADGRLVGYACGPFTPNQLHARCLALLTGARAVLTPQHYVVCAPGPDDWPDRPVLAQGSGRP